MTAQEQQAVLAAYRKIFLRLRELLLKQPAIVRRDLVLILIEAAVAELSERATTT